MFEKRVFPKESTRYSICYHGVLLMKKQLRKFISVLLVAVIVMSVGFFGMNTDVFAYATGTGLAEHALTAYYGNWTYVYGAMSYGCCDCSGLIMLYEGVGGSRTSMCQVAYEKGYMGSLPRIHGLGLWQPGHVGVYIGNGMAVDARSEWDGVCYQSVWSKNWQMWFKVVGVNYPTTGWESFNGDLYYYEDGEYLVSTERTIDGVVYGFNAYGTVDYAYEAEDGDYVDTSEYSGGTTVYETAAAQAYESPVYYYDDDDDDDYIDWAAIERARAEEEERRRQEEEERRRQQMLEEARQAAIQRYADARNSSVTNYLTAMTAQDPYETLEPETIAISAGSELIGVKEDAAGAADAPAVSLEEAPAVESELEKTTVTMQRAMEREISPINTAPVEQRHPGAFILVILATALVVAGYLVVIRKTHTAKNKN